MKFVVSLKFLSTYSVILIQMKNNEFPLLSMLGRIRRGVGCSVSAVQPVPFAAELPAGQVPADAFASALPAIASAPTPDTDTQREPRGQQRPSRQHHPLRK